MFKYEVGEKVQVVDYPMFEEWQREYVGCITYVTKQIYLTHDRPGYRIECDNGQDIWYESDLMYAEAETTSKEEFGRILAYEN